MYATRADLENMYGVNEVAVIATRDTEAAPSETSISRALQDATDFMNTHLASRYDIPLSGDAPSLKRPCADIALYYLAQSASSLTEEIEKRYERALAYLRDLSKGVATLAIDPDGEGEATATTGRQVRVAKTGPDRLFARDALRDV